ncbi:OB-fold protein [Serratia marcescens]|uniref:OB-fold protein n=1 Tax=Serratia marcescens TaxID=615 RepID=UPI000D98018E|nr:hypothetical protein [Serratia marcescens]MDS0828889.1 hypothetical protein [Serratia marcescens]PYA06489.1 hypothetical protein DMW43_08895 [Serratia marcescens]
MMMRLSFIFMLLTFCNSTSASNLLTDEQVNEALTPNDSKSFVSLLSALRNEFTRVTISNNSQTLSSPDKKTYSAKDLTLAYKKNEITATEKFKGKTLRVRDKVQKIGLTVLNDGFIRAGTERYGDVIVMSVDKNNDSIRKMSTGDTVDMVCTVGDFSLETLYLKKCITTEEAARKSVSLSLEGGDSYHLPESRAYLAIITMYKVNEKDLSEACSKSEDTCIKAVNAITSKDGYEQKMKQYIEKNGILDWANTKKLPRYHRADEMLFAW